MRKSCVKCQKAVKSTERVLVCGLWCRKSFHIDCVGLTSSEISVVTCSNERIKFHCETCESRLGIELGGKETQKRNKLQNCVDNCLLELVQKILKLTNELSSDNSVINKKLDTVISSNTRLEDYILQSPNSLERRNEETAEKSVEVVDSFSAKRTIGISEASNDTNLDNTNFGASMLQSTDDSAINVAKQLFANQEPLVAEERSSDEWEVPGHQNNLQDPPSTNKECLQEWELHNDHGGTQDLPSTNEEECIPAEYLVNSAFSITKTEYEGGEEKAETEIDKEGCSSSEDFLECSTFSIEKIEHNVDGEAVREDILEELKHEVESARSDNESESTITVGPEDDMSNDDTNSLKFQCTAKQEISDGNNIGIRCAEQRCKICKRIFTNFLELKKHTHMNKCKLRHSCEVCDKIFASNSRLEKHIRMHARKLQNSCDFCNKKFTHSWPLMQHLLVHTGVRPYNSSVCCKTFNRKSVLLQHFGVPSDERPYSCTVCRKSFRDKTTLKRHLRVHSGECPYSCSVCSRTFKDSKALQYHLRVHSGERPFSCSVCRKSFRDKATLKRHLRVHSGERPYRCSVCSKTFKESNALQDHFRVHSGERPFSCSVCRKSFRHKSSLKRHLWVHSG